MFLSSLRIRGKLTLLVIIPLLAMVGLVVPVVRGLFIDAGKANEISLVATVAGRVGSLLQDVQRERLLSIGYLLGVVDESELELQTALVTDKISEIRREPDGSLTDEVRSALDLLSGLDELRQRIRAKAATSGEVLDAFIPALDGTIDALELVRLADADTDAGRQLIALDALLRMDESNNESSALLAVMAGSGTAEQYIRYHEERTEFEVNFERFEAFATQPEQDLYSLVADAFLDRLGEDFDARFEADPAKTMAAFPITKLFPSLESLIVLGGFVEKRLVDDVTSLVAQQRQRQLAIAYGVGGLVVTVLLAVLILVAVVARTVAVPLTRLSRAASRVADAGETELQRIADDDSETAEPVRFEELDMNSADEIGDLARVFERVQSTAAQLVERQVLSRRNVAEMFGHIGRRTQNLVGGQVTLIDELENEETDPERLAKLYRLDHISNRLRRSADSLVVISGAEREESHRSPVRLVDVARLALAEIEEYTRVDVDVPLDLMVAPAVVSDLVLVCGELLENATNFSPPHTRVKVQARAVPGGVQLVIADQGIGMPDERLAEENARIARRERLDLVPTQVLGLFVVGRLARRHNLSITLSHTAGGGVTVAVSISGASLSGEPLPAAVAPVAAAAERRRLITAEWTPAAAVAASSTPHRSAPEAVPAPLEEHRPNVRAALSRVNGVLNAPITWNGFGVADEPATVPAPALPEPPVPSAPAHQPAPPHAAPDVRPGSGSEGRQIKRRVPGATLSPPESAPQRDAALSARAHDPDAARNFVEQFELGVAQAFQDTSPSNRQ